MKADIALEPLGGGEGATPLYIVDLSKKPSLQVDWPTTDAFEISLKPISTNDAKFSIAHTLVPNLRLWLDLAPLVQTEFRLDATDLINLIPGAAFNYSAIGSETFSPWGFEPVTVNAKGNDLLNSKLFSISTTDLGITQAGDLLTGSLSLFATTDIDFTYQTTEIQIKTANPITAPDGKTLLAMTDANYLELYVTVIGEMTYAGTLDIKPGGSLDSPVSIPFAIDVGLDFPVATTQPLPVVFPGQILHVPLPNVFVPSSFVDFGAVDTGNKVDKKVVIDNTGELGGILEFESSDPQFTTGGITATQVGPGQTYDLSVSFRPTKPGQQKATITVKSNDPDSPEQTFDVIGYGQGDPLPEDPGNNGGSGGGGGFTPTGGSTTEDSGCGCRVPQGTNGTSAAGLLAVAGLALLRRRRKQSKRA
ncbi:MAG: choice-of-anchor D domain-containing protein [Polyangiaceae bacterium]